MASLTNPVTFVLRDSQATTPAEVRQLSKAVADHGDVGVLAYGDGRSVGEPYALHAMRTSGTGTALQRVFDCADEAAQASNGDITFDDPASQDPWLNIYAGRADVAASRREWRQCTSDASPWLVAGQRPPAPS